MSDTTQAPDLAERVIRVIAKTQHIPVEAIHVDSTFEQLKIDSLDGINIVFALETEFGVNVPDDAARNLRSIRDVVNGISALLEANSAAAKTEPPSTPSA